MIRIVLNAGLWMVIIITTSMFDYLVGDFLYILHPKVLILKLIRFLKILFNRGEDLRVKGLLFWLTTIFLVLSILFLINSLLQFINPFIRILLYIILLSPVLSEKFLYVTFNNIASDLEKNDLTTAKEYLKTVGLKDNTNPTKLDLLKFSIETEILTGVDGIIGPQFYMFIGLLISILIPEINPLITGYLYLTIVMIPIEIPNTESKYKEFSYYPFKLYNSFSNIPYFIGAVLIILSGIISGYDYKYSSELFKKERKIFPKLTYRAPLAAVAGVLGIQLSGLMIFDGENYNNIYIGKPHYPIKVEDIDNCFNLILSSEVLQILGEVLLIILGYLINSFI